MTLDRITKALEQARQARAQKNTQAEAQTTWQSDQSEWVKEAGVELKQFSPDPDILERNRIQLPNSDNDLVQPYKILRTRLLQVIRQQQWNKIGVVSPAKYDGKTTLAINLAMSIANGLNDKTVLLDLDLLNPSIGNYLGYQSETGVEHCFLTNLPLADVLMTPGVDGLAIAPAMDAMKDSSEFLATDLSHKLLDEAAHVFEDNLVLVDLPPLLVSDDAISVIPHLDAIIIVIREGHTKRRDVEKSLELVQGRNIAGIVLNDTRSSDVSGYYYY